MVLTKREGESDVSRSGGQRLGQSPGGSCREAAVGLLPLDAVAQVLQRRRNHETFKLYKVAQEERPDLLERFGIETVPTLVVVENKHVRAKLEKPRGCRDIEKFLQPWLH